MRVAIVGPFYQGKLHLRPWLGALAQQTYPLHTVLIVDDASKDGTSQEIDALRKSTPLEFDFIALTQNRGPSAVRNIAIKRALAAGADLVLLLDSDCRVGSDWVERHVSFHQQNPSVGIVGGAIQGTATSYIGKSDGFGSWFTAVPNSRCCFVDKMHLSSTNMSLKRSVFEKIGFFDEDLATGEDVAYCRKAQRAAIPIWFQSDIVVTHLDRNHLSDAKKHHYRWGLHSYTLSSREHGGYYGILQNIRPQWLSSLLIPAIAAAATALCVAKNLRTQPKVLWYTPGIFLLKWWNAVGVYRGLRNPTLCLRPAVFSESLFPPPLPRPKTKPMNSEISF